MSEPLASETNPPTPPTPPPTEPAARPTPPRRSRRQAPPLFTGTPQTPPPAVDDPTTPPAADRPRDPRASQSGSASESPDGAKQAKSVKPAASSVSPTDRRQLKKAIAAAVRTIGGRLNAWTTDEVARDQGAWLADDQDQEGIAEPGSTLAARHIDLAVNPDVADLLAILIALADYASKNFDLLARVRRLRKAGAIPHDQAAAMTADQAPPPPTGAAA